MGSLKKNLLGLLGFLCLPRLGPSYSAACPMGCMRERAREPNCRRLPYIFFEQQRAFSSKSPENSTLCTVERGVYLYPWPSARYPQITLFQLIYSSLTDGFKVKLYGEKCTNSTFSRIHVLHARLLPTKVLKTIVRVASCTQPPSGLESLRRFWPSGLCS